MGSTIIPTYASGEYFQSHEDPDQDAAFKADEFSQIFRRVSNRYAIEIGSYLDCGCGGGRTAALVATALRRKGHRLASAVACDVYPGVENLRLDGVECVREDFCRSDRFVDLVTLFDVIEHVPDPVGFLRQVASRCSMVALHIPLDNTWINGFFDRFEARLEYPGHLTIFDTAGAINLLTAAGVVPVNYSYTRGYRAPSGSMTGLQRLFRPLRGALSHISPWAASRLVGGVSLMIAGLTATGIERFPRQEKS